MLNLVITMVTQPNETALYYALRRGTCDVAISGLQFEPRRAQCGSLCPAMPLPNSDCCIEYGTPYLFSSMSLLSQITVPPSGDSVIAAFSSPALVNATLLVTAALLAAAALLYFAERVVGRKNREVTTPGASLYWGITTLTTVGFGDVVPRSSIGRAVTVAWTLTAFVTLGTLSALLTSSLTSANLASDQINTLADVNRDLCTMQGDPDIDAFLAADETAPTSMSRNNLVDCIADLLDGGSQAVLSYRPSMTWLMNDAALPPLHLSPPLNVIPLVFAYPQGSTLRPYVDSAVGRVLTDPEWMPSVEGIKALFMGVPLDADATAVEEIQVGSVVVVGILGGLLLLMEMGSWVHGVRKHGIVLPDWLPAALRLRMLHLEAKHEKGGDAEHGEEVHVATSLHAHGHAARTPARVLEAILAETAALNSRLLALQEKFGTVGTTQHPPSPPHAVSLIGSEAPSPMTSAPAPAPPVRQPSRRTILRTMVNAEVELGDAATPGEEQQLERHDELREDAHEP